MNHLLISYAYHHKDGRVSFHYGITESIEEWIEEVEKLSDGPYVLVFAVPITDEQAQKWDGDLKSM